MIQWLREKDGCISIRKISKKIWKGRKKEYEEQKKELSKYIVTGKQIGRAHV